MKVTLMGRIAAVLLMAAPTFAQTVTRYTPIYKGDVPAAVWEAFKSAYPHASVRSYTKVEVNGAVFYKIESVAGVTQRKISYNPDGTISKTAERIAAADLPADAQQAIPEKYPKAKITSAEKVTEAGQVTYEVSPPCFTNISVN